MTVPPEPGSENLPGVAPDVFAQPAYPPPPPGYPVPQGQPQYGPPGTIPPPGYPPAYPPGYGVPQTKNGLGIAAMVLGIIGALSGLIPLLFWMSGILGVLAVIFGLIGRGRAKRTEASNKGQATAGFVLGVISLVLSVVGIIIIATTVHNIGNRLDTYNRCIQQATTPAEINAC